jgi:hypothetical protein
MIANRLFIDSKIGSPRPQLDLGHDPGVIGGPANTDSATASVSGRDAVREGRRRV